MRDILVISLVVVFAVMALRRPWIGVMLWTWISIMNPHRYAWGFATTAPVAMIAALVTLLGLLLPASASPRSRARRYGCSWHFRYGSRCPGCAA